MTAVQWEDRTIRKRKCSPFAFCWPLICLFYINKLINVWSFKKQNWENRVSFFDLYGAVEALYLIIPSVLNFLKICALTLGYYCIKLSRLSLNSQALNFFSKKTTVETDFAFKTLLCITLFLKKQGPIERKRIFVHTLCLTVHFSLISIKGNNL